MKIPIDLSGKFTADAVYQMVKDHVEKKVGKKVIKVEPITKIKNHGDQRDSWSTAHFDGVKIQFAAEELADGNR